MHKLLSTLTLCAISAAAQAAPIFIENHSFEADFAAPGTFPTGNVTGWDVLDPFDVLLPLGDGQDAIGVLNPTTSTFFDPDAAPDGDNVALIYLSDDIGQGPVSLTQELGATLQANTVYTLQVEVGNIASGFGTGPFADTFFDLDGFPGYAVSLYAGGQLLDEDVNTLVIEEGEFLTSTVQVVIGDNHDQLGQHLEIRLTNLNLEDDPEDPGIEVDFDNVRLDAAPIPEPAVAVLFAAGLTLIAGRRRF